VIRRPVWLAAWRIDTAALAALDGVQPELGDEFAARIGTTMASGVAMPQDWFPKTVMHFGIASRSSIAP
jgi:hypothetical protein